MHRGDQCSIVFARMKQRLARRAAIRLNHDADKGTTTDN
jgi:hypothetical protein